MTGILIVYGLGCFGAGVIAGIVFLGFLIKRADNFHDEHDEDWS